MFYPQLPAGAFRVQYVLVVAAARGVVQTTWHFKKPGKDNTYVFMFMGIETEGKALDLVDVMHKLGWKEA